MEHEDFTDKDLKDAEELFHKLYDVWVNSDRSDRAAREALISLVAYYLPEDEPNPKKVLENFMEQVLAEFIDCYWTGCDDPGPVSRDRIVSRRHH